jgi:pyridoxine/pyridoxamine 5'-phosphate oxidase
MLTTEDGGQLRARPMVAAQDDFDGTLWFFTRASSHKVSEVESEQHVGVTYADAGKQDYVSLSGTARLIQDKATIQAWAKNPAPGALDALDVKSSYFLARINVAQDDVELATDALVQRVDNAAPVIIWRRPRY